MEDSNKRKLIDDYIMDRLNKKDRASFEVRLDQDLGLKEEMKIRRIMIEQIKTIGDLKLKDRILNIQKKVEQKDEAKIIYMRFVRIAVAIAAALILGIFTFQWINSNAALNPQLLFAQYYKAYELPFANRSTETDSLLAEIGALYIGEEYAKALPLLEQLQSEGKADDRVQLAIVVSNLELGKYQAALTLSERLASQNDFLYQGQAKWYSALTYLQLNQIDKSKKILQTLADDPTAFFKKEAQQLLLDLDY